MPRERERNEHDLTIVYKALDELKPYENNPRNNKDAVKYVKNSIKKFGFKVPIVIDKDNVIVAGHTRYLASKELKLETVPCIIADDLTEKQIKAYRLADNKTAEKSEWDFLKLDLELDDLKLDFDMSDFGFDFPLDEEKDERKNIEDDDFDTDKEVEKIENPISRRGDIYKLGNHYLMCGDSTSADDVSKLMNSDKADLVVTDPPYNVAYEGKTEDALTIENDSMDSDSFRAFLTDAFSRMNEVMKEGASFYIWYASREHVNFEIALNQAGFTVRQQLIWNKNQLVMGRQDYHWKHEPCLYGWKDGAPHNWYSDRKQSTVLDFDKPQRNGDHPTMKPLPLIGYLVQNSSKKNDVVLDLFGGSGSTLIACEELGRSCRMMELDPKYCDVIVKRWETLTGNKAEKIA